MRVFLESDAEFSMCTRHDVCAIDCIHRPWRWTLTRRFPCYGEVDRTLLFIMLNPSTASHVAPDPTITRLMDFTRRWGFTELVVCNIFAWRSTDPKVLPKVTNPVGVENDRHIRDQVARAERVVIAWGNHGKLNGRDAEVLEILRVAGVVPLCFKITKAQAPEHPLYQPKDAVLVPFDSSALYAEHRELAVRKVTNGGLSASEQERLRIIRRSIDRIEGAELGDDTQTT